MSTELACPRCTALLEPPPGPGVLTETTCGGCDSKIELITFAALAEPAPRQSAPELRLDASQGSCFFHPQNKARLPCDVCGRFLCSLCDLELQGTHLCPTCLESGRKRQDSDWLASRRFIPERAALCLSLYPLLMYPVVIITAPVSLFFALRGFRRSPSPVPEGHRRRAVIAGVLSILQLVGIIIGLIGLLK